MKKIGSEKKYSTEFLSYKVGSTDKKNPCVMYIDGGVFIEPHDVCLDYKVQISTIRSYLNNVAKKIAIDNGLSSNLITNIDIADDRIRVGRKSYLSFQFYFRQINMKEYDDISDVLSKSFNNAEPDILSFIDGFNFSYSKSKK